MIPILALLITLAVAAIVIRAYVRHKIVRALLIQAEVDNWWNQISSAAKAFHGVPVPSQIASVKNGIVTYAGDRPPTDEEIENFKPVPQATEPTPESEANKMFADKPLRGFTAIDENAPLLMLWNKAENRYDAIYDQNKNAFQSINTTVPQATEPTPIVPRDAKGDE